MVARSDLRFAGATALLTAALVFAHTVAYGGGPQSSRINGLMAWHVNHQTEARVAAILWLLAMFSFVLFTIAFRDAMWASIIDRYWVSTAFVQGAGVFATIAAIWAAMSWAMTTGTMAGAFGATEVSMLWHVAETFKQFALYGLVAPLLLVGATLFRHSAAGRVNALLVLGVIATLVVPQYMGWALLSLAAWMAVTGLVLLVPTMDSLKKAPKKQPVAHE